MEVTKENLKKMFSYSKYKLHYIDKLVTGEKSTVYRCGTLVDLCRGPHIQNTGKVKTFKIMQVRWNKMSARWTEILTFPEFIRLLPWRPIKRLLATYSRCCFPG